MQLVIFVLDSMKVVDDSTLLDRVPYSDCEIDSDIEGIEESPDRSVIEETQTFDAVPARKTVSITEHRLKEN